MNVPKWWAYPQRTRFPSRLNAPRGGLTHGTEKRNRSWIHSAGTLAYRLKLKAFVVWNVNQSGDVQGVVIRPFQGDHEH